MENKWEKRYNSRIRSRGQSVLVVESSKVICFIRNCSIAPASEATSYFVLEPCGNEGCIGKDVYVGAVPRTMQPVFVC